MNQPWLSRRHALAAFGAAGALNAVPVTLAHAATDRRFVMVILRGALDGLAAVPPFFDPDYDGQRGALAFARPGKPDGALDLDGRYGLNPALKPLHDMYAKREMAVIHAVATPYRERSHFDAQDLLENGSDSPRGKRDGWLNRALGLMGANDRRLGLSVGNSVPLILRGDVPVGGYAPQVLPVPDSDFLTRLAALYRRDPALGPAIEEGLRAQAISDDVLGDDRMAGNARGNGANAAAAAVRTTAQAVGRLLAAAAGPRIAVLEIGGWDTHANQGVANGRLAATLRMLADGMAALRDGLGASWRDSVVAVATEFGRTVAPNGTQGTDHGTASVAFLLGGAVQGGRVIADWPGLASAKLYERRDLAPTTDLRSVLKPVLAAQLGLPADAIERVVFPDSRAIRPMEGLVRA